MSPMKETRSVFAAALLAARNQPWSFPLLTALLIGIFAIALLANASSAVQPAFSTGLLLSGASMAVGSLLGFLFGIPRAIQSPNAPPSEDGSRTLYQVNTNLEQISDWLTKILVGIGLVELGDLKNEFNLLCSAASVAFVPSPIAASLAGMIIVYFGVLGFLAFYLWTRIFLTTEFSRADRVTQQSPEFVEGLAHAYLYQTSSQGFRAAIEIAEAYREKYGEDNWRIWRVLACGYAQLYAHLKESDSANQAKLEEARSKSLEAVKRVLELNPDERKKLISLWDPTLATPQENDLTVFFADEEFKGVLLGKAAPTSRRMDAGSLGEDVFGDQAS